MSGLKEMKANSEKSASDRFKEVAEGVRMIVSDFDGCIVPYRKEPNPELVGRVKEIIRSRGNRFGFAVVTGRDVEAMSKFSAEADVPVLGELGNVLHEPTGETHVLLNKNAIEFISNVAKPFISGFVSSTFPGFTDHSRTTMLSYSRPDNISMEDFVSKIIKHIKDNAPEIGRKLDLSFWTEHTIDISYKGNNKGKAVEFVSSYYKSNLKEAVYIGDGNNDIPAFKKVLAAGGIGVAPSNSDKYVMDFASKDKTGRMIVHGLESTECVLEILSIIRDTNP